MAQHLVEQDVNSIQIEKSELVAIVRVNNYEPENVRRGIERIFDLLKPSFLDINVKNKTVLLKPSILAPEKSCCTNEVVLEQIGKFLKKKIAKDVLVGDSTMTKAITSFAHKRSGLDKVAEKFNHPIINFLEEKYISITHNSYLEETVIRLPQKVVEADIIINVPKMKTHIGFLFTGAIKNLFGLRDNKTQIHKVFEDKTRFQRMLGDLHMAVLATGQEGMSKPVLHILDGIVGMEGKGPRSGKLRSFNCLIASFSPVAVDCLAYTIMGGDPKDIEAIQSLGIRNKWPASIDELKIVGDDWYEFIQKAKLVPKKYLQSSRTSTSMIERISTRLIRFFHPLININRNKCVRCLDCLKNCPNSAMEKKGFKKNKVSGIFHNVSIIGDLDLCCGCGLCVSVCPVNAINYLNGRIEINNQACFQCGLCFSCCPRSFFPKILKTNTKSISSRKNLVDGLNFYLEIYSARAKDKILKSFAQDGGIVTSLLKTAFNENLIDATLVVSTAEEPHKPLPLFVSNSNDLLQTAGTKYTRSPSLKILHESDKFRSIAIVGLPCTMEALKKISFYPFNLLFHDNITLKIGLFCMESFNYEQIVHLLKNEFKKSPNDIKKMNVNKGRFYVIDKNGSTTGLPIKKIQDYRRMNCLFCDDLTAEIADISVGSIGSKPGWSTVILRTEKGRQLFQKALKLQIIEKEEFKRDGMNLFSLNNIAKLKRKRFLEQKKAFSENYIS